mmetsp:Transcript_4047/g.12522  ORF Transcript_4047/g.12522 Transcript_4047/m.12522 type:complete len:264 (+) Transcript_4047:528-1319(+)
MCAPCSRRLASPSARSRGREASRRRWHRPSCSSSWALAGSIRRGSLRTPRARPCARPTRAPRLSPRSTRCSKPRAAAPCCPGLRWAEFLWTKRCAGGWRALAATRPSSRRAAAARRSRRRQSAYSRRRAFSQSTSAATRASSSKGRSARCARCMRCATVSATRQSCSRTYSWPSTRSMSSPRRGSTRGERTTMRAWRTRPRRSSSSTSSSPGCRPPRRRTTTTTSRRTSARATAAGRPVTARACAAGSYDGRRWFTLRVSTNF